MNGQNNDLDILGLNDPMKRKAASAQMTSVRGVAEYYEYQEKQKTALAAHNRAQSGAQREKDRIEAMRYEANERAQKERDRVEHLLRVYSQLEDLDFLDIKAIIFRGFCGYIRSR